MLFYLLTGLICQFGVLSGEKEELKVSSASKYETDWAELGGYDGGDLKLTPEQHDILYTGRRSFTAYKHAWLWEDAIVPYEIRNDFSYSDKADIEEAMRIWERDTCIRFRQRTDQPDYVRIQDGRDGCSSYLGNIRSGAQTLNLQNSGCMVMGTYLHELGHALGLIHEHQRPDRENYIHVYEENVKEGKMDNLKVYKTNHVNYYGVEFDLSSIMLYGLTAFSKDGESETLGVENSFYREHVNGRRYRHMVSFGDIKIVNTMYQCGSRCKKHVDCQEPGFVNERCECVTKESYLAQRCKNNHDYEDWCDNRVIYGYCDRADKYLQRHCMKSCDFCPIFSPGTSGLVKAKECVNHYSNSKKCDEWARKGYCYKYPAWLQRHCRKSCDKYEKTCSKKIGLCANRLSDNDCEGYANHLLWDYCGSPKTWGVKTRTDCPDSCKVCPA